MCSSVGSTLGDIKSNKGYSYAIRVLDIGAGKGGDLKKYEIGRVKELVCCDIAETSVSQCKERYTEMEQRHARRNSNHLFKAEFIVADCTRDRIKGKLRRPDQKFDLVSCQFAFHYSFESLDQAECMLRNVAENLLPGGFFIGTTPDANDIMRRVSQAKSHKFGNDVFGVTFSPEMAEKISRGEQLPIFGAKYSFRLDEQVQDCPEFLVHMPALIELAKKYGLDFVRSERFEDYAMDRIDDDLELLGRMNALETYPPSAGSSTAGPPEDYTEAERQVQMMLSKNRSAFPSVGTLSRSEWECASIYLLFVFKRNNLPLPPLTETVKSPPKKRKSS